MENKMFKELKITPEEGLQEKEMGCFVSWPIRELVSIDQ